MREELDFEEKQAYNLLVFTFLGDKSITNKLDLNVVDVDEEPLINLNMLSSSLGEDVKSDTKFAEIDVMILKKMEFLCLCLEKIKIKFYLKFRRNSNRSSFGL